jgi:hypothetical protein
MKPTTPSVLPGSAEPGTDGCSGCGVGAIWFGVGAVMGAGAGAGDSPSIGAGGSFVPGVTGGCGASLSFIIKCLPQCFLNNTIINFIGISLLHLKTS